MAGLILFDRTKRWSVNSPGFTAMIDRTLLACQEDEMLLADLLCFAKDMRILNLERYKERGVREALAAKILLAAREYVRELTADPEASAGEIASVRNLADVAQAYLAAMSTETSSAEEEGT